MLEQRVRPARFGSSFVFVAQTLPNGFRVADFSSSAGHAKAFEVRDNFAQGLLRPSKCVWVLQVAAKRCPEVSRIGVSASVYEPRAASVALNFSNQDRVKNLTPECAGTI